MTTDQPSQTGREEGERLRNAASAFNRALEHMAYNGELRVYIAAGEWCKRPPKVGSGVIISDLGRMEISGLTVRRIREVGTKFHYRNYKYGPSSELDTFDGWEVLAAPLDAAIAQARAAGGERLAIEILDGPRVVLRGEIG